MEPPVDKAVLIPVLVSVSTKPRFNFELAPLISKPLSLSVDKPPRTVIEPVATLAGLFVLSVTLRTTVSAKTLPLLPRAKPAASRSVNVRVSETFTRPLVVTISACLLLDAVPTN